MNRTRRKLIALPPALLALAAVAQDAASRPRRLGIFHFGNREEFDRAYPGFFSTLASHGWREGSTLSLDWRQVRMDSPELDRFARELVAARPDAIFTESTPGTRALAGATRTIPIVTSVGDPVRAGFAASAARPGGNITGIATNAGGSEAKAVEILKILVPGLKQVAVFGRENPDEYTRALVSAASAAGLTPRLVKVRSRRDIDAAVRDAATNGAGAGFMGGVLDVADAARMGEAAVRHRLPLVAINEDFRDVVLLTLQAYQARAPQRLAALVDKVLRGTNPATLAFDQPEGLKIIVNRKLARQIAFDVPGELLLRATDVID